MVFETTIQFFFSYVYLDCLLVLLFLFIVGEGVCNFHRSLDAALVVCNHLRLRSYKGKRKMNPMRALFAKTSLSCIIFKGNICGLKALDTIGNYSKYDHLRNVNKYTTM